MSTNHPVAAPDVAPTPAEIKAAAKVVADAEKAQKKAAADAVKAEKAAVAATAKAAKEAAATAKAEQEAAVAAGKAMEEAKAKMQAIEAAKIEKAAAKAEKEAAKAKKKQDAEQGKADKLQAKAQKALDKEANKMPVQNGIRRPGPDGKCGRAWALMDEMSKKLGAPVAIADLLVQSTAAGLNPAMTRSNYAVWRKFNNVQGRVVPVGKQLAVEAKAVEAKAKASAKEAATV